MTSLHSEGHDSITIPIVTIIAGGGGGGSSGSSDGSRAAFSLALDPTDPMGEVALARDNDAVGFERSFLRFDPSASAAAAASASESASAPTTVVSFSAHIVAHQPSWRSGLHFYTQQWNSHFVPKVGDAQATEYEGK